MRLVADGRAQEAAEHLLRAAPALRDVEHVARDRHVEALLFGERDHGGGALHALGDHVHSGDDVVDAAHLAELDRSEAGRGGKECGRTCEAGWWPDHIQDNRYTNSTL